MLEARRYARVDGASSCKKIDPIPVEKRNASEAYQTLLDLKDGKIIGRAALMHD